MSSSRQMSMSMVILGCREELRDEKTELDEDEEDLSSPDSKKSIAAMSEFSSSIRYQSFSSS